MRPVGRRAAGLNRAESAAPLGRPGDDLPPGWRLKRNDALRTFTMNNSAVSPPIVVGIDGSKHAVQAAVWAIGEAISRNAPLRLVHVINGHRRDRDRGYAYAGHVLHKAWVAVQAARRPVMVESDVLDGDPIAELVEISRTVEMICVGSRGTNDSPRQHRGATAAELARRAYSPVAIIQRRYRHWSTSAGRCIVAVLDASADPHAVLETAWGEAELRHAPVVWLTPSLTGAHNGDRALRATLNHYLDEDMRTNAKVRILHTPTNVSNLLAHSVGIDPLVIICPNDIDLIADIVGPKARSILGHANCALLIVPDHRADRAPRPMVHAGECVSAQRSEPNARRQDWARPGLSE